MESLAYLHLAVSVEADSNSTFADLSVPLQASCAYWNSLGRNWRSTRFWLRLLAITTNLTILAIATQANAQALKFDNSGAAVTALQKCLVSQGLLDTTTFGYFGEQTEAAVKQFQRRYGLEDDGIVGKDTDEALRLNCNNWKRTSIESYAPSRASSRYKTQNYRTLRFGDYGEDVGELQKRLQSLRLYQGPIDNDFGSGTQAAVAQFQRDNSLRADGVVELDTWTALGFDSGRNPRKNIADKYSVLALQQRLKDQDFYQGRIDGDMGPATERAIAAAQQYYGVTHSEILTGRLPR